MAGYAKDPSKTERTKDGQPAESTAAQIANYGIPIWKRILNGTTVTLGCNNVFGHDPPDTNTGTNYADFAYDSTGRFVYVGLTKKFRRSTRSAGFASRSIDAAVQHRKRLIASTAEINDALLLTNAASPWIQHFFLPRLPFEKTMASEAEENLRFEIGHVLFLDVVGYSKLLIDEQKEQMRLLTDIVLATRQVQEATNEQLVRLPTGDGMALVFRNSLEEPAQCALEIARALKAHPEIRIRMGIHSGPVSEVSDVNERTNIAGAGINLAQRVMDCGDAGHILVSRRVAEDLAEYRQWSPHLHHLGRFEVKHGVKLSISNLFGDDFGNPAVPAKLSSPGNATPQLGNDEKPEPRSIFAELQRRHVYRAAVVYTMTSWLLIQVATQVFPFFNIANWVVRLIVILLVVGFPIAVALAWAFELTPEGIVKTDELPAGKSSGWPAVHRFYTAIIGILAIAIAILLYLRFSPAHRAGGEVSSKSIAVLPFENLSAEKENAYFAAGILDDLLTNLAKIQALTVISRTSVMKYRDVETRNIKEIGQTLGVATILEGSVRRKKTGS